MSFRPLRPWAAALALAVTSCQRPASTETSEPEPPTTETGEHDGTGLDAPAAEPTHPLELVPSRARMMLMARSPLRLAQAWERERFAAEFPEAYDRLVRSMKREMGLELFDPDDLGRMGIDVSAPIGAAVLSLRDEAVVFFGALSDREALVTTLEKTMGRPLPREQVGSAEVLVLDPELVLVIRGRLVALVTAEHQHPDSPDYAREIARIDPARSLAHTAVVERAFAGLPGDSDLRGLLDPAGLLTDALAHERQMAQQNLAGLERQLAELRQQGASPDELESFQKMIQDERRFMAQRRRRQQIVELLLSRTIGSIGGIGMAVDASDRGLLGRIHVALDEGSAFRQLLIDGDAPPRALTALGDSPQVVASGHLDVDTAIELLSQVAMAEGSSYAELNDEIRDDIRLDFDRELRPHLDGRATFALTTQEPLRSPDRFGLGQLMGGVLAIGIDDEAAVKALLDRVLTGSSELSGTPTPEISGYEIDLPDDDGPSKLWVGVTAGQLVLGTDLAALRRLRDSEAGPAGSTWREPEAWPRLTAGPAAARLALRHRMPVIMAFGLSFGFDRFNRFHDGSAVDFELEHEFPELDVHATPRGPKVRRLHKAHEQAMNDVLEIEDRRREEKIHRVWNHADALGVTVATARQLPTGLMLEGGHYVEGGLGAYLRTAIGFDELDDGPTSQDAKWAKAVERVGAARQALLEARRKELRRAAKARSR